MPADKTGSSDVKTKNFVIRMTPEMQDRLDEARRHVQDIPTRAELARRILEEWLEVDEARRADDERR